MRLRAPRLAFQLLLFSALCALSPAAAGASHAEPPSGRTVRTARVQLGGRAQRRSAAAGGSALNAPPPAPGARAVVPTAARWPAGGHRRLKGLGAAATVQRPCCCRGALANQPACKVRLAASQHLRARHPAAFWAHTLLWPSKLAEVLPTRPLRARRGDCPGATCRPGRGAAPPAAGGPAERCAGACGTTVVRGQLHGAGGRALSSLRLSISAQLPQSSMAEEHALARGKQGSSRGARPTSQSAASCHAVSGAGSRLTAAGAPAPRPPPAFSRQTCLLCWWIALGLPQWCGGCSWQGMVLPIAGCPQSGFWRRPTPPLEQPAVRSRMRRCCMRPHAGGCPNCLRCRPALRLGPGCGDGGVGCRWDAGLAGRGACAGVAGRGAPRLVRGCRHQSSPGWWVMFRPGG